MEKKKKIESRDLTGPETKVEVSLKIVELEQLSTLQLLQQSGAKITVKLPAECDADRPHIGTGVTENEHFSKMLCDRDYVKAVLKRGSELLNMVRETGVVDWAEHGLDPNMPPEPID